MASVWTSLGVNEENLQRVGPMFDEILSTDAGQTDINAAYTAGARLIGIGPGAVLTANLTISAANTVIWSPFPYRYINLGAYTITVSATDVVLEGFEIDNGTGVGITLAAGAVSCEIKRIRIANFSSHGIELTTSGNDNRILECYSISNGGDGIKNGASADYTHIYHNLCWNNGGMGLNDLSDTIIEGGNKLSGNTGVSRTTSSASIDGASRVT